MIRCGYWIKTKNQLPEPGQMVLALQQLDNGTQVKIIACYVTARTEEYYGDDIEWVDIDEDDNCWLPEGWYEQTVNGGDYSSMQVYAGDIKHWMTLPEDPAT